MSVFFYSLVLFLFGISFDKPVDEKFMSIDQPEPFLHYSAHHNTLFFAKEKEKTSFLKAYDISDDITKDIGVLREDTEQNFHDYHISIGLDKALVKKESTSRPKNNKLVFLPLSNRKETPDTVKSDFADRGLYHMVNDSTLYVKRRRGGVFDDHMGAVVGWDQDALKSTDEKYPLFSYEDDPLWEEVVSAQMYKMKAVSDDNGITCSIFKYSSWLLCSDADGTELFATHEPEQSHFPELDYRVQNDTRLYTFPDPYDNTVQNFDIAMDERHVYILTFGENISRRTVMRLAISRLSGGEPHLSLHDYATTSQKVFIYRKSDGKFLKEVELPNESRALTVSEDHLIVTETDEKQGIRWIPKSDVLKIQ